ncbi:MAG TPA: hypothetical protein VE133_02340, partial [Candidatus Sulfotelmatobacter sp.]|nr:hypothetical protein [Candidatus Sulfotelmatobacter sp.]
MNKLGDICPTAVPAKDLIQDNFERPGLQQIGYGLPEYSQKAQTERKGVRLEQLPYRQALAG